MKPFTMHRWIYVLITILLIACTDTDKTNSEKGFEVSGVVANNKNAKEVYLIELPAGSSQGTIVDTSVIDKDGRYKLQTGLKESLLYSIRIGQDEFPAAYLINDVPKITVDIVLDSQNNQLVEKYELKGSPVSQEMKGFMSAIDDDLKKIYYISRQADSLKRINAPDSAVAQVIEEWKVFGTKTREFAMASLNKAKDPALVIFELGYYQSASRGGLQPLNEDEINQVINNTATKFPDHKGVADVKKIITDQAAERKKMTEPKWVGKQAPDFSLPDPNGKAITLSSFRGKYVLVDFWASWCVPCRNENPNVVKAFNRFRDKNFTILGVSLDNPGEKNKWMTAVMKDNLTWTQVSDLKGWQSAVVPMYDFGEVGIPYNILVNPEGIVIAERLTGSALEAKLEEVLK